MFHLFVYRRTDYLLNARRILPLEITVLLVAVISGASVLLSQGVLPAPYSGSLTSLGLSNFSSSGSNIFIIIYYDRPNTFFQSFAFLPDIRPSRSGLFLTL
jgi:hypothetical protein